MRVKRQGLDVIIDQVNYLKKVLERFQMTNTKPTQTPLPSNWDPKENKGKATAAEITCYQSIIGSLLYLMIGTHPDISYAVTHLSQSSTNPSEDHYKAAMHICHYLAGTQDYTLVYGNSTNKGLMAYMDSDWAANGIQHQSVTGYFFKLADGIVSWRSHAVTFGSEWVRTSENGSGVSRNLASAYVLCLRTLVVPNLQRDKGGSLGK